MRSYVGPPDRIPRFCPYCGSLRIEGARFCPECGSPVPDPREAAGGPEPAAEEGVGRGTQRPAGHSASARAATGREDHGTPAHDETASHQQPRLWVFLSVIATIVGAVAAVLALIIH